jgi:hypothetical protein
MRRSGEVLQDEIDFVKGWLVWSRISRKKHPEQVRVDAYDWNVCLVHTAFNLRKVLARMMENENFVFYVQDTYVPKKIKHEPEKDEQSGNVKGVYTDSKEAKIEFSQPQIERWKPFGEGF